MGKCCSYEIGHHLLVFEVAWESGAVIKICQSMVSLECYDFRFNASEFGIIQNTFVPSAGCTRR